MVARTALRADPRRPGRADARTHRGAPVGGPKGKARPRREPPPPSAERAEERELVREDKLVDLNERLDRYAASAGWDSELTEEVRVILLDTTDHISASLAAVDRGELAWEEEKEALRAFRLDQAATVRGLLGDEFDGFVKGMQFERFFGEVPIQGRLPP